MFFVNKSGVLMLVLRLTCCENQSLSGRTSVIVPLATSKETLYELIHCESLALEVVEWLFQTKELFSQTMLRVN